MFIYYNHSLVNLLTEVTVKIQMFLNYEMDLLEHQAKKNRKQDDKKHNYEGEEPEEWQKALLKKRK